jgi:hypothetical protein
VDTLLQSSVPSPISELTYGLIVKLERSFGPLCMVSVVDFPGLVDLLCVGSGSACEDSSVEKVISNSSELAMVLKVGKKFLLGMNLPPLSSIPEKQVNMDMDLSSLNKGKDNGLVSREGDVNILGDKSLYLWLGLWGVVYKEVLHAQN